MASWKEAPSLRHNSTVAEKGQPTSADPVADRLWPRGQTIRADRPSVLLIGEKYLKRGVR